MDPSELKAAEWIAIAAIFLGPIVGIQMQRLVDRRRERRNRRLAIFHTLMATRAERLAKEHVQALNMIDIEFYGRRIPGLGSNHKTAGEKAVTNAWRLYSDSLSQENAWAYRYDRFVDLLYELGVALGYEFDKVQLKRNVYSPVAHGDREKQDAVIRDGIENLLTRKTALAVVTYQPPPRPEANPPAPVTAVPAGEGQPPALPPGD